MNGFWKGRRVFITGHTGFKGSWLTLLLHELGAEITGFSLDVPTVPSIFQDARCAEVLENDVRGDIRNFPELRRALEASNAEVVFHLAAQPLVRHSYADPLTTYGTNVMGTLHVLLACLEAPGVKSIVNVTTDKCYENREVDRGYRESDCLGGFDPYSSSKACAEILSSSIRQSFLAAAAKNMSTVRAGNVIGGGDWAMDRLIPDFMRAYKAGNKLKVRSPSSIRPWQHVLDPLKAYLLLAEKNFYGPEVSEAFNIGPEEEDHRKVQDVVSTLQKLFPTHQGLDLSVAKDEVHEAGILKLDCAKAKTRLGWAPTLNLDTALRLTGEWYLASFGKKDMREFTLHQIREFLS